MHSFFLGRQNSIPAKVFHRIFVGRREQQRGEGRVRQGCSNRQLPTSGRRLNQVFGPLHEHRHSNVGGC